MLDSDGGVWRGMEGIEGAFCIESIYSKQVWGFGHSRIAAYYF